MAVISETSCVVIIPFADAFVPVRRTVVNLLKRMDVRAMTVEHHPGLPGSIAPDPNTRAIQKADLIIADITGSDPNVMYEVGFAHALKKPVLLIVRSGAKEVPFDLRGELFFVYESDRVAEDKNLEFAVHTWVERYIPALQGR
jgi:nucleoside 2-deoxyribosyltransferase